MSKYKNISILTGRNVSSVTVLTAGVIPSTWNNTGNVVSGAGYVKDAGISVGWNKGGSFFGVPAGKDCELQFTMKTTDNTYNSCFGIFGFSVTDTSGGYTDLIQAFQFNMYSSAYNNNHRRLYVYAQGQLVDIPTLLDVYKIKRTSGIFEFFKNGVLVFTSPTLNNGALLVDSSINAKLFFDLITLTIF